MSVSLTIPRSKNHDGRRQPNVTHTQEGGLAAAPQFVTPLGQSVRIFWTELPCFETSPELLLLR
jgi:hypothetical protein